MPSLNRRTFLQSTAAGAGLILTGTAASGAVQGANDRVRIAVAGLNGRGRDHINGWLSQDNVEIAYVIDPDESVLSRTLKTIQEKTDGKFKVKGVRDVRQALDDPNLDAISVATPNHWHSLITIWAAQAGKNVYVEKPMSHDVVEGRVAVEAQKKYGVVIQHGTQRRSDPTFAGLSEAIQAGKWGKLKISYGYSCKPRVGIGFKPVSQPPENLDWNLWRGPADVDQYTANYHPYNWHWFWKTGNGDLNNNGTHMLDLARWALDKDQTHPIRTMSIGGRFQWKDQGETPNTMFSLAEYPNGQYVFFNVRNVKSKNNDFKYKVENEYYFEDGGRILRDMYYPKGSDKGEKITVDPGHVTPGGNWGAFIAAVRANDPSLANGNVQDAHYACVLGHVMNYSYRLGEQVPFSAKAGRFGDNADAAEHFGRLHEIMAKDVGVKDGAKYTVGPMLSFDPETEKFVGDRAEEANALLKDTNRKGFEVPEASKV
ncbi:gfo/Idh/MocA family oxidoreductase [bacterium]|nr:gfo/Idh/MocA family oxidoreductase [bacterium]